jgi:epsilon-lactone hydrolase
VQEEDAMVSSHIIDFAEKIPPMPSDLPLDQVPAAQAGLIELCVQMWPADDDAAIERVVVDDVEAVWHLPPDVDDSRVILYVHGGGYVWCSAESHAALIQRVAVSAGAKALALDYRVAPQSPFPGPVKEGVALYKWLLSSNYEPSKIAIAGDSAGGGLALAIMHALAMEGVELPGCVVVTSPWTDLTNSGESIEYVADPCVSRPSLDFCVNLYLCGQDASNPLASPLFGDFSTFPPLLVQVGSREKLLSDSTRLAARADAAGVDVELEVYDRCNHLWHWWVPEAPEAKSAVDRIGEFIAKHTS